MKTITIELNEREYTRYINYVSTMMTVIRPFIFRDTMGQIYCINHGAPDGNLIGISVDDVRTYAEEHSNIRSDETLNLICCYGGKVVKANTKSLNENNISIVNHSVYPVAMSYDEESNSAVFGIPETDDDLDEFVAALEAAGITTSVEELKGTH